MSRLLAIGLVSALVACPGPDPLVCVDPDGDEFGEGCERGLDCDEGNPLRNRDCDLVPPPDCTVDPTLTGCPCLPGRAECFPGDRATIGVGMCRAGSASCVAGSWGLCDGAIAPTGERCNTLDDDCDGLIDEGAQSPCGGCTPGCLGGVWGEGADLFDADDTLALTPRGALTLRFVETESETVWVANSGEDTLSRISDEEARETARYETGGSEPSRVAVDYFGDAWVLNREFDGVGSLRRVAGDPARCVDRDDSGTITTSRGSDLVVDDECVLTTFSIGGEGDLPRALAIDGNLGLDGTSGGDPWVGLYEGEAILRLDARTGDVLDRIETPGFQPYAFAFDPWGTLVAISKDGLMLRLDRHDVASGARIDEVPLACFSLYGLAVDSQGRVLMTGFECDSATLFDPITERYTNIEVPPSPRGAVVSGELGYIAHTDGRMSELSLSPLEVLRTLDLGRAIDTIGVGVTARGVWLASGFGGADGVGLASRVDLGTGEVADVDVGRSPHTQGDLTGAKRLGAFLPEGTQSHVFAGCDDGFTRWRALRVAAEARGGVVEVATRHADTEAALASVEYTARGTADGPDAVFPLELPEGGFLEVELRLSTPARDGAPLVRRVGVEWQCPGPD